MIKLFAKNTPKTQLVNNESMLYNLTDYATYCKINYNLNSNHSLTLTLNEDLLGDKINEIGFKQIIKVKVLDGNYDYFVINSINKKLNELEIVGIHWVTEIASNLFIIDSKPRNLNGVNLMHHLKEQTEEYKNQKTEAIDLEVNSDIDKLMSLNAYHISFHDKIAQIQEEYGFEVRKKQFELALLKKVGRTQNPIYNIEYGSNLIDFIQSEDFAVVRGILPVGYDGIKGTIQYSDKISQGITLEKEYNIRLREPDTEDDEGYVYYDTLEECEIALNALARQEFTTNKIDEPLLTFDIKYADLGHYLYTGVDTPTHIEVGDVVKCAIPKYSLDINVRVHELNFNVLSKKIEDIVLSNNSTELLKVPTLSNVEKEVGKLPSKDEVYNIVHIESTNMMNAGLENSHVVVKKDEILVMDSPNIETAQNIWRWNKAGLMHSTTGYNGVFTMGMRQDGIIIADIIKSGTISSFDGNSWWNLESGEFSFEDKVKFVDGEFSIDLGSDLGDLVTKEDLEDLQDKIDEVDERLDTALGNIDQAFKDQIISEAEKRIIEKTLETLAEQHAEMEDLYNKYKDHENLTDETKTTLKNKWTPYNSGYIDLVAYINEIIADDKCTETEVNSYKTKVEEYNARYIDIKEIINACLEEAINNYTDTKVSISEGKIMTEISSQYVNKDDLNDALDEQNTKITTIEQKYSTLEQDIDGFKTEVGQKYTTIEEFGQLEVGATNLIRNANFDLGLNVYWTTANNSVTLLSPENDKPTSNILAYNVTGNTSPTYIQKWSNPIPIEWDKEVAEFIFRFEVKSENWNIVDDEGVLCCARTFVNSDKTTTGIIEEFSVSKSDIDTTNNGWQTVVMRIRVTNNTAKYIRFGSYCSQNSNCKFREFMAVKGNRIASTFSINPSDTKEYVDGEIEDYTQTITREYQSAIEQTKNDITLSVSSTYVTKTEIEQMVIGGGDNLLRNGNFEYELKHWSVEDYDTIGTEKGIRVIGDNSTGVPKGKHLLQISGVNTNNYYGVMSDEITFSNYTSYVLSGYCAGNNVNHISVIIRAVTETGSTDIIHKEYTPKAGGTNLNDWERFEIPFTTTEADTYVVSILSYSFDNDNKGHVWFTDVQLEQGNKATPFRKCPLDISEEVDEVQDSVTNLNTYINGALEDKILDKTERQAIEQQLRTLEAEKADINKEYTTLNSNAKLTGTPKTTLTDAYNDYISKYNALVTSINNILDAEDITVALKNSYNTAYTNHNNSLATYRQAYIDAFNSITTNYIETMKQALSEEIDDVQDSVDNLNTYVDGAFKDGILSDAEKQAIREQLKVLSAEKADIDNEYAVVINDSDLNGEPKTNLANAYNDYVSKYNALVTSINNILNSTFIILTLREFYDTAYTNHNNALATLKQRHVEAINAIAEAKKQASITTSKNYTDAQLTVTADAIRGTVSQLREDFDNLEIGGENLLKNSEFITTEEWTIATTVDINIDTSNKCSGSNSMKIFESNALFDNYAKFSQTFAENVSTGQKFAVSGYYYVDDVSLLQDKKFSISLKGKTGSQTPTLKDATFDKTNCKVKQWTKFSFTTTLNQNYDSLSLVCSLERNGEVWFSKLQVERGDIATDYSPASTTYATKSEMELTSEEFKLSFQTSGSGNLLKNSDCQFGLNGQWVNNGGGLDRDMSNAKPFLGSREPFFKTSFPNGFKYSEPVYLKPNTDYVYQAYVYVGSSMSGARLSPVHFWSWVANPDSSATAGQVGLTVLDYKQDVVVGEFSLCYVHFKTENIATPIGFLPFIYGSGTVSHVGVKQICLKEGKTPSIWIPHSSEINEGITTINEHGIQVSHSNIGTKTRMTADGFYFLDENDDMFASLSSKDTWASLRVQEVFANNIENVYTGNSSLYVNHSKASAGDGSINSPFNSFGVLSEYLESMPIINKDLTIYIQNPNMEINEQLTLTNLKGTGSINIVFDKNCILRSSKWAIVLTGINKLVAIDGGRSSYDSSDGAIVLDKGNESCIMINDCKDVYIHSININCKNNGIRATRSRLRTRNIDFCKTWCAIELNENSMGYDGDSCGNCNDFVRSVTGSVFTYGSSGSGICPFGNKAETSGKIFLIGNARTQRGSYRYPTADPVPPAPTTATYTQTFKATGFGTYQYAWSNWASGEWGNRAIQGNYQNIGNKAGHVFFDLSAIRSFLGSGQVGSCTITITRRNGGGVSGATNIYVNASSVSSASGTPSYSYNSKLGTLSWGQTKTFNLSSNIVNALKSSAGAIAFYSSSDTGAYAEIVSCSITIKVTK